MLLTCTSKSSRNYSFGKLLGSKTPKEKLDEYLKNNTVEGVYTLKSLYGLIKVRRVKMPFLDLIYNIVFGYKKVDDLIPFLKDKE